MAGGGRGRPGEAGGGPGRPGEEDGWDKETLAVLTCKPGELDIRAPERHTHMRPPQVDTFVHAVPSMNPLGGGRWLLHVHVLMHFR